MGLLEEIFQAEMGARLNPRQPIPESTFAPIGQLPPPPLNRMMRNYGRPIPEAYSEDPMVPMMPAPNPWAMYGGITPMRESWSPHVEESYNTEYAPYNYIDPIGTDISNIVTGTEAPIETTPWDAISAALEVAPVAAPFKIAGKVAKPAVSPIAKPIIKKGGEFVKDLGELFSQMEPQRVNPLRWTEPLGDIATNIREGKGIQELKKWMGRPNINPRIDPEAEKFFDQMHNIQGERITDRVPIGVTNLDEFSGPSAYSRFINPTIKKAGDRLNTEIVKLDDAISGIGRKFRDQVSLDNIFASKQRSGTLPASLVFDAGDNPIQGKLRVNIPGANDVINEGSMFNRGTGDPSKTWLNQFEETVGDYLSHPIELQWMFYRDAVDELQRVAPKHPQLPQLTSLSDDAYRLGNKMAQELTTYIDRSKQINIKFDELQNLNLRLHEQWNKMAKNRYTETKTYSPIIQKTAIPAISLIPEAGDMARGALDWWNLGEQISTSDWGQRMSR